jgi:hypothetical protein
MIGNYNLPTMEPLVFRAAAPDERLENSIWMQLRKMAFLLLKLEQF